MKCFTSRYFIRSTGGDRSAGTKRYSSQRQRAAPDAAYQEQQVQQTQQQQQQQQRVPMEAAGAAPFYPACKWKYMKKPLLVQIHKNPSRLSFKLMFKEKKLKKDNYKMFTAYNVPPPQTRQTPPGPPPGLFRPPQESQLPQPPVASLNQQVRGMIQAPVGYTIASKFTGYFLSHLILFNAN